ncbi:DNA mismatch repair endonuclease MutH [Spirabiliibacterium falconis]|uniref:DNA mismatch repair endonuclease MutH n=1 Tax=Spirabiliibacterium falconis TaxID=572023 RepID=UPI001AAD31BE|nr:DNA mismatch repair endonuclease MutH [Spirabiliibacterium falconis]MBE2893544.1 DNA mismatch repair endonuclease MutH [Spirabiliibacterium falconis]
MSYTPQTEQELLANAQRLAGLTLAEIAEELGIVVPRNLQKHKGWVGMLLETALGASAGSKAEQDFHALGIELKTIPINAAGQPLETTFVSLAPLTQNTGVLWENSHVRKKLQKVLWIPVEGERQIPLEQRRVGVPILWQPSIEQERQLAQDWEELMELIVLGDYGKINARIGEVLQLRPKGANSRSRTLGIDVKGNSIQTLPLGFYLRKIFTQKILQDFLNR